ncbi:hypothetical protein J437_LFUL012859 [Ladona fulva]|uniref:Nucleolar GTP-binding protein 2 n=1 Tax=Ladona fulva TaxID=123851 RepID=A0A8K0P4X1_LADFU|nr:hypothetical protein J437_LFUL012859 [Ladona fulva]
MGSSGKDGKGPKREGFNRAGHSMNPERPVDGLKGVAKPRTKSTIKRLQMYRNFKAKRNRLGKIIKEAPYQGRLPSGTVARVEPSAKWFGNSRVIGQSALQRFQEELGAVVKNPYQVVMKPTKLPITLLQERAKNTRVHILDTESFESVFGPKRKRKRPVLRTGGDLEELTKAAEAAQEAYGEGEKDRDKVVEAPDMWNPARDWIMGAGQSRRIWNELHKVIDSSDVLLQVLDARDPLGTRSKHLENFLRDEKPHKHLIFVLNKVDLVPNWVTQRWVAILSAEYPTIAFHASLTHPFGKGALIDLLRQFARLHADKKQISIGLVGYPNTGKSSIVNTLRSKKVCNVAPIAGETKVWQYVTLMRRIYLIDCPGVVPPSPDETDTDKVLRGVVRVELVPDPEDHIPTALSRLNSLHLARTYGLSEDVDWKNGDPQEFLEALARRFGKLLKGGEPDIKTTSKIVLNDWQRGKLPFYVPPPGFEVPDPTAAAKRAGLSVSSNVEVSQKPQSKAVEVSKDESNVSNEDPPAVPDSNQVNCDLNGNMISEPEERNSTERDAVEVKSNNSEKEVEDEKSSMLNSETGKGDNEVASETIVPGNDEDKSNLSSTKKSDEIGKTKESSEADISQVASSSPNKEEGNDNISVAGSYATTCYSEASTTVSKNLTFTVHQEFKKIRVNIPFYRSEDYVEEIVSSRQKKESSGDKQERKTKRIKVEDSRKQNSQAKKKASRNIESEQSKENIGENGKVEENEDEESSDDSSSDDDSPYPSIKISSSGAFKVTSTSPVSTIRKKKVQKGEEFEEQPQRKLTSKMRRRIERSQKRKKIGSNFYEVTNVKNRNRDRRPI